MNSNRTIEELLQLFEIKNISELGSGVIRTFFDDISYKEVMKLCRVNKQFNIECNKESMWKQKVKNDYGIFKMYESTWKKTAHLLFESNMINMNQKWINDKTYQQLFSESLEEKNDNYFYDLYNDYEMTAVVFPDHVVDVETAKNYIIEIDINTDLNHREKEYLYHQFNHTYNCIIDNDDTVSKHIKTMSREFSVIAHAAYDIINGDGLTTEVNKRITRLIDPNLFIMSYSSVSEYSLSEIIHIWE